MTRPLGGVYRTNQTLRGFWKTVSAALFTGLLAVTVARASEPSGATPEASLSSPAGAVEIGVRRPTLTLEANRWGHPTWSWLQPLTLSTIDFELQRHPEKALVMGESGDFGFFIKRDHLPLDASACEGHVWVAVPGGVEGGDALFDALLDLKFGYEEEAEVVLLVRPEDLAPVTPEEEASGRGRPRIAPNHCTLHVKVREGAIATTP